MPSLSISSSIITGLLHADLADRLDDVAGQGADIGAPVAADLALVVHAAQRDAGELAAHGAGDALAEAGLADARRADEAQDRAPALRRQLVDGQVLDDPLLDLLQVVMVLVEDALRLGDVDPVLGLLGSRAARSACRDRRAACRARPRPRACAPAGAAPCWPAARTSSGIPASAIAFFRSSTSAAVPSSSPSSFLIVASCSRSSASRWRFSSVPRVASPSSRDRRSTPRRWLRNSSTRSMRRARSKVSSTSSFSARADVHGAGDQVGELARPSRCERMVSASSRGACGSSSTASSARSRRSMKRASISVPLPSGSSTSSKRAARNGWPPTNSRMRKRCWPWQIR